jgi:hypothetical protein
VAKWLRYGNTYFKAFFNFHQIGRKRTLLKELEVDGKTISKQEDLSLHHPTLRQVIHI